MSENKKICGYHSYQDHKYTYLCHYFRDGYCAKLKDNLPRRGYKEKYSWRGQGFDDCCSRERTRYATGAEYIRHDKCGDNDPLWKEL